MTQGVYPGRQTSIYHVQLYTGIGWVGGGWLPVQEMVSTPGPKYSTMAPVPPFTVRMPATLQMMSLGEFHLASLPVSFTPMTCKQTKALGYDLQKPHS